MSVNEEPYVSLWSAFLMSGPLQLGAFVFGFFNPILVFLGAWKWHWPQLALKMLSILPLAATFPICSFYLKILNHFGSGETGFQADRLDLRVLAFSSIQLLLYVGFLSVFLSLLASCVRPRPNPVLK